MKIFLIALAIFSTSCSSKPKLHIFCWGDFISQEIIETFEKSHDCEIVIDTFDSNESMFAKLQSGATGYDLIFPTHYYVELLKAVNLIEPFDVAKIPNLKNIDPELIPQFKPSSYYIPYMLSYTGIGFRKDLVQFSSSSWSMFNESKYKNRMTLLADFREVIGVALITLGYSVNTVNVQELEEATQVILQWKKNIAKFENEQYLNGLANHEYLISHGYSTYIAQLMKDSSKISFVLPKEGGIITLDTIAQPVGATQKNLSHEFVNLLLDPEFALLNMEKIQALPPIKNLPIKDRSNPALFPDDEALSNSQSIFDVGENIKLYLTLWNKILEG